MKRLLILLCILLAILTGCSAAPTGPRPDLPVLMGDVVPCVNCEENVAPVNGRCPICGAILSE